jgi:hypothetical protein
LHDFLQNYARHKTTKPFKTMKQCTKRQDKTSPCVHACVIIHTALVYRSIHTLYTINSVCIFVFHAQMRPKNLIKQSINMLV